MGPGGWRSAPQLAQRWMRNSPSAAPAQKKELSGVTCGRNDVIAATMSS